MRERERERERVCVCVCGAKVNVEGVSQALYMSSLCSSWQTDRPDSIHHLAPLSTLPVQIDRQTDRQGLTAHTTLLLSASCLCNITLPVLYLFLCRNAPTGTFSLGEISRVGTLRELWRGGYWRCELVQPLGVRNVAEERAHDDIIVIAAMMNVIMHSRRGLSLTIS